MTKITEHVSFEEATHTNAKAPNIPTVEHLANIKLLCENVFEPLRKLVGGPIRINSIYRSKEVNALIKGSSTTSQHMKGEAMDIDAIGTTNAKLGRLIKDNLKFDQLIFEAPIKGEPSWIHVSYSKVKNRGQVLIMINGKYIPFNTNLINK